MKSNTLLSKVYTASSFEDNDKRFTSDELRQTIDYKGENKKHVMIVLSTMPAENSEEETLLLNILKAVDLTKEDVAMTTIESNVPWKYLNQLFEPKHFVLFGIEPSLLRLHIHYQKYFPINFHEATFLFADTLSDLKANKDIKMKLWNNLKSIFS